MERRREMECEGEWRTLKSKKADKKVEKKRRN